MADRLPAVRPRDIIRALQSGGFILDRQSGSHVGLLHPETGRKVTVAMHNKDVKRGTLAGIIRQSGLSRDEFVRFL